MFKNYFLLALRSFKKERVNALISLSGLIIGLASIMLVAGYVHYETSFDKSYSNAGRIYRIISTYTKNDEGPSEDVPVAFAPTLVREVPGMTKQTRIITYITQALIKNQYADFMQSNVDSSFFSIFNFRFIHGNPNTSLNNDDNIVLTASVASRFFNTTDVVGKPFITRDKTFIITGVVQDMPQNSFLQTEAFCFSPLSKSISVLDVSGQFFVGNAFLLLNQNISLADAENKIKQFCHRYKMDDYKMELQPVSKIHLYSSDIKGQPSYYNLGDLKYVYIYICVALLILAIGCINFINLSIARSMERTREVGVRKVLGARRKQLITQFVGEAAVYFIIAFFIALALAATTWAVFTQLSNINAGTSFLFNTDTLLPIAGVCVVFCLVSAFYPALFLSGLQPVNTLKGDYQDVKLNFSLRKVLIVVQFSISIILIVATTVVHSQLTYLNNRPLGFNKDNLVSFKIPFLKEMPVAFKNELLQNPNINNISFSSLDIGKSFSMTFSMKDPKEGSDSSKLLHGAIIDGDMDFAKTFQIPVIAGRDFSTGFPSDMANYDSIAGWTGATPSRPLLVSESLVKQLGIKDPIGKIIDKDFFLKGTIIGVFKSFSAMSLKDTTPMIAIRCKANGAHLPNAYARINASNTKSTIESIGKLYKQFFPQEKFDFRFIDEQMAHLYDSEIRLTRLSDTFAGIAIVLSCMGLFSLISLMVRKRTKEIGIRKVMGASVKSIVMLISKDFLWLIVISLIIATPLAYIAMNKWLQGYANRTGLYWWMFLIAGLAAFVIAAISISFKSITAARANPVKSLRTE
ncbi:FtsX-like permease family protein [Parafilimonas sp.]|uniref:ABC transporter permease n=1 Tax=Parafilimonas sp. TaxID=1969739 RepID=UPI0039E5C9CC